MSHDDAALRALDVEVEELIAQIHVTTPSHGAFVLGCPFWPCSLVGIPHRFSTDARGRRWNEPGECYLCGEDAAHVNHAAAVLASGVPSTPVPLLPADAIRASFRVSDRTIHVGPLTLTRDEARRLVVDIPELLGDGADARDLRETDS